MKYSIYQLITDLFQFVLEFLFSFFHTLIHLFKGNVGPGMFAMGFAFSNGGLAMSPFLTILISLMCVNCQHMLLNCSKKMQNIYDLQFLPDFATTVELCFVNGPQRCIRHSTVMRKMVNMFIVITQLGFCCVYFVFVSSNINQVNVLIFTFSSKYTF